MFLIPSTGRSSSFVLHLTDQSQANRGSQILTGTDNHIAGLGSLVEWLATPMGANPKGVKESPAPARGKPGYEGYLNERVVTIPEILKNGPNPYLTLMSGKWHLGLRVDKSPWARGFDRSFGLLPGASNHFGWEPELQHNAPDAPKMFSMNNPLHMKVCDIYEICV